MPNTCPFNVDPYKIVNTPNRPTPVNLNYTNQDFWSMKSRLITFIQQNFGDKFNDFVESSIALMLIENWAFIADTLSFKIDQIANEIFIDTVTELDNAFRLANLVGFKPQPPIASSCLWTARINSIQNIDVTLPTPYDVRITNGDTPINYEIFAADNYNRPLYDEPIVIAAGKLVNSNLVGLEGQTITDSFLGSGLINQSFTLSTITVLEDSVRVYVSGEKWTRVDFFTDSQPRKEYILTYNSDYSATIVFGNNRAGLLPALNVPINVVYRVGGGPIGDIVSNAVSVDALFQVPNQPFSVVVNLTNYTRGQFGYSGDTIEDIRRKLPPYLKSQNRAVSGEDYKTLSNQFYTPYNGTMGKATVALRHSGCSANIIDIYVLTRDGVDGLKLSSSQFKAEFIEYVNTYKMLTDSICVKDGVIIDVEVIVDVVMSNFYKSQQDKVESQIRRNLEIFFNLQNWDYGQNLKNIDILKALNNIAEPLSYTITLHNIDSSQDQATVPARYFEIIRPFGTPRITFNYQ
jgi:hypothetical protein